MSQPTITPGEYVVSLFGGPEKVAMALKIDTTTVYRWAPWPRYKPRRNKKGVIPPRWYRPLLDLAETRGVELSHLQLIYGNEWEKHLGH